MLSFVFVFVCLTLFPYHIPFYSLFTSIYLYFDDVEPLPTAHSSPSPTLAAMMGISVSSMGGGNHRGRLAAPLDPFAFVYMCTQRYFCYHPKKGPFKRGSGVRISGPRSLAPSTVVLVPLARGAKFHQDVLPTHVPRHANSTRMYFHPMCPSRKFHQGGE